MPQMRMEMRLNNQYRDVTYRTPDGDNLFHGYSTSNVKPVRDVKDLDYSVLKAFFAQEHMLEQSDWLTAGLDPEFYLADMRFVSDGEQIVTTPGHHEFDFLCSLANEKFSLEVTPEYLRKITPEKMYSHAQMILNYLVTFAEDDMVQIEDSSLLTRDMVLRLIPHLGNTSFRGQGL